MADAARSTGFPKGVRGAHADGNVRAEAHAKDKIYAAERAAERVCACVRRQSRGDGMGACRGRGCALPVPRGWTPWLPPAPGKWQRASSCTSVELIAK